MPIVIFQERPRVSQFSHGRWSRLVVLVTASISSIPASSVWASENGSGASGAEPRSLGIRAPSKDTSTAAEPRTLVRAARVLDVQNGTWSADQGIVVSGGRIESVLPFAQARSGAPDAAIIDLGHVSVLPGFADCHAHLLGNLEDISAVGSLRMSSAQGAIWGVVLENVAFVMKEGAIVKDARVSIPP